jgi:hypothetical protein
MMMVCQAYQYFRIRSPMSVAGYVGSEYAGLPDATA